MRTFISIVVLMMSFSGLTVHAAETMKIQFTKDAQVLFEKGNKATELLKVTKGYTAIGGAFDIVLTYQTSKLNDTLSCYHFVSDKLSVEDGIQMVLHSIRLPSPYSCEVEINTEVTAE